jgi:3-phosphoshikimate 1-carboxyvinyltransferase
MTDALAIPVAGGPIHGRIRPPGSKSLTNRALVCAGLARGTSTLTGCLDSQDTRVMAAGLQALGVRLQADWDRGEIRIEGTDGRILAREATIDCAASGTTMRFLAAVCALGDGTYRLDGTARMRRRPIGDLVEALRGLGVDAIAESAGGCPPVLIRAHGLRGGEPCMPLGLRLTLEGTLVSLPYLEMTRRLMESFGATCTTAPGPCWSIAAGGYEARDLRIEPDASAASYFFAAAALTGGSVRVDGLSRQSVQGDVAFCDALERMGCTVAWEEGDPAAGAGAITVSGRAVRGIDIDMNAISDTVPTLAVVALFAATPTTIRNVAHIRDKETDRIGDLVRELRRLGANASEHADGLTIVPGPLHGGSVATYDDHRMAMSLGLVGLLVPGVRVEDPTCVGKTFPEYWRRLAEVAGFTPGWPAA